MNARWIRRISGVLIATVSTTVGGVALAEAMEPDQSQTAGTMELVAAVGGADLFPGSSGGDIHLAVVNTSADVLHFTSGIAGEVVSSSPSSCPASSVLVTVAALDVLAAAHSTTSITLAGVVTMLRSAPDGCQGVTFTVAVTLDGAAG